MGLRVRVGDVRAVCDVNPRDKDVEVRVLAFDGGEGLSDLIKKIGERNHQTLASVRSSLTMYIRHELKPLQSSLLKKMKK